MINVLYILCKKTTYVDNKMKGTAIDNNSYSVRRVANARSFAFALLLFTLWGWYLPSRFALS